MEDQKVEVLEPITEVVDAAPDPDDSIVELIENNPEADGAGAPAPAQSLYTAVGDVIPPDILSLI